VNTTVAPGMRKVIVIYGFLLIITTMNMIVLLILTESVLMLVSIHHKISPRMVGIK